MRTVFIRAIEADVDDKAVVLREAIHDPEKAAGTTRFEVDPNSFRGVPKSPFAYWVKDDTRRLFSTLPPLESQGRVARRTNGTTDDGRWIRTSWEIDPTLISPSRSWVLHLKGGAYSPFYSDPHLVIAWDSSTASYPGYTGTVHRPDVRPASLQYFFRPGLTWPRRTNGLSFRAMPAGCIFGDKGPAIFVDGDQPDMLLALCAIINSRAFASLVAVQLARTELAQSYEVGIVQRTPVPDLFHADRHAIASLARRAWSLKRALDTRSENSHAFTLPSLLQVDGATLSDRAEAWLAHVAEKESELAELQAEIDNRSFKLYGIDDEERTRIEQGFDGVEDEAAPDGEGDGDDTEDEEIEVEPMAASLLSWALGIAFGRFDVRLATGSRALPAEPEPFDPLPVCSPGMLTGEDGLPFDRSPEGYPFTYPSDGVIVDDPGHPRDLMARVRAVFEAIFGEQANERLLEAESYLGGRNEDLRTWFAKRFFATHVKLYSRSRRKAPIYWQLGTPSGSYSAWCYCHRFSSDTLFRLTQDYVAPKVEHEERKLNELRQEAGRDPSSKQRKVIATQESFVEELRAFKTEVARIAPLWNPNLNDGVIINFAPLWRLIPQHKSWQKECKKVWDNLQQGDYDWSRLAMHLWPERVVPKCADDRSLAIAHGLEENFWYEEDDGKWNKRKVDADKVQELISERASTAVKAALNDLLGAPTPGGGRKARKGRNKG